MTERVNISLTAWVSTSSADRKQHTTLRINPPGGSNSTPCGRRRMLWLKTKGIMRAPQQVPSSLMTRVLELLGVILVTNLVHQQQEVSLQINR
eukprot:6234799-Amphidinium_carterae.1